MRTFASKAGWILAALLGVTLVASWTGVISAGSLDPPGPIGPSMKSLDDIPGSWSRLLSAEGADPCATERFDCVLLDDDGVLDRETGLVWMRIIPEQTFDFQSALRACHDRNTGDRHGWRLPTVSEQLSLIDIDASDGLPPGHPFVLIGEPVTFWSSTLDVASATRAMRIHLVDNQVTDEPIANAHRYWCVRGPGGGDVQ